MPTNVAIIGVPSSVGGLALGSERGPDVLRQAGLVDRLRAAKLDVTDLGNVPVPARRRTSGTPQYATTESVARWVCKYAWRALEEEMTPLVIGGDHSAAIGSIAAAAQSVPSLGIVWIDAHPDFNTPATSPTGNIHGMVLAIAAGWGPTSLVRMAGFAPMVHPERIVVVGARSIDAGETKNLRDAGVRVFDGEYVERHGIREAVTEAMAYLDANQVKAVHVSVDLDVLDPERYPGVSTPVRGGLTAENLVLAVDTVAHATTVASMDVVEFTPPEDRNGVTLEAALAVCTTLLGTQAAQPLAAR
jgi:arginase